MKALGAFASALALLCPLNAVVFPSVSPFWTVSNLASLNNLRFDYPLDPRSVEWLILGPVLDADVVNPVLSRDALRSATAVEALCESSQSNLDPKCKVPLQTSSIVCSAIAGTWHDQSAVWVGVASAKRISLTSVTGSIPCKKAACLPSSRLPQEPISRLHVAIQCSMLVTNVLSKGAPDVQICSAFRMSICGLSFNLDVSERS